MGHPHQKSSHDHDSLGNAPSPGTRCLGLVRKPSPQLMCMVTSTTGSHASARPPSAPEPLAAVAVTASTPSKYAAGTANPATRSASHAPPPPVATPARPAIPAASPARIAAV